LINVKYIYQTVMDDSGFGTSGNNSGQLMMISGSIGPKSRTERFTYDDLGRLATAYGKGLWGRRYTYDRWGNRTGVYDATSGGNQIQSVTLELSGGVPTTNQIASVGGVNYSYDASGNLTSDGGHNYQYDAEGRMATVDVNTASSTYDSANRRVKKVAGGVNTHYVWEGSQVIAEYNGTTGTLISEYVFAGSRMVAREQSGVLRYFLQDRLSTRLITDSSAVRVGRQDYLPFGEDAGTGSGESEKHRFTTYERDIESGTDYAVNRQYHPASGRFMRPDPAGGSIGNPQSANRYSYALNDPVNFADPTGLDPFDWMTDASVHGPGVYLDGTEVMREMWGMVFNLWAIGAADIDFPGLNGLPEWYKKEYGIQDPNDSLRLLAVGFQDDCQQKVARVFGGEGAVGGDHGVLPGKSNSNPIGAAKAHVYPSKDGSGQTDIYVPAGYDSGVFLNDSNSTAYFHYGNSGSGLFGYKDVTLLVQHVANVPNLNQAGNGSANGRVRIGTTGGLDGGQVNGLNYQHAHIEVFRGKGLLALVPGADESQQTNRNKARISYRDVFCQ
jgi:RHS repeat-associated protein